MADTNTYTSKQNIKKYTTQAKFDAIDKSDVPVGTEYNIVGAIAESDLDSDLQAKIETLDGQVAELETNALKKQNVKTVLGALITGSGDIAPTVSTENGGALQPFYRMFINKDLYNTLVYQDTLSIGAPKLKTIFGNQSLVGTGNIDLYKHHIVLTSNGEKGFFDFYSSKKH